MAALYSEIPSRQYPLDSLAPPFYPGTVCHTPRRIIAFMPRPTVHTRLLSKRTGLLTDSFGYIAAALGNEIHRSLRKIVDAKQPHQSRCHPSNHFHYSNRNLLRVRHAVLPPVCLQRLLCWLQSTIPLSGYISPGWGRSDDWYRCRAAATRPERALTSTPALPRPSGLAQAVRPSRQAGCRFAPVTVTGVGLPMPGRSAWTGEESSRPTTIGAARRGCR
jgi:hypothetical protein